MTAEQQREALRMAAQWLARLAARPEDAALLAAWRQWRQADPAHQWAWQRVERMQAQLQGLPGEFACRVLEHAPASLDRRAMLKHLALLAGVGALGWNGYHQAPVWLADQRTGVGERRSVTLSDGTRLALNTASAVDIRFSAQMRLIHLRAGEILLSTGVDPRPLLVRSAEGHLRALGTRFSVRQNDASTRLEVFEQAVAVTPLQLDREQRVEAGQGMTFSARHCGPLQALEPGSGEWVNGRLLVNGWPLRRLLGELRRYRHGYLGWDDAVAELPISGAFPLDDLDMAFAAIARALPVQVRQRSRYWTRVVGNA
ncbi:FecR domain-containing protein [Pseudomonas japonica]|uniref:FecR family protein n=1 Tax=Pseudomonas japonica TaxID=256466 RepID=A0A239EX69_9PSED|nr:FecR domain-containing protein [Pseudomonas japonica]SNS49205.1 FecR family protein [Pseudomonas japonica]